MLAPRRVARGLLRLGGVARAASTGDDSTPYDLSNASIDSSAPQVPLYFGYDASMGAVASGATATAITFLIGPGMGK